MSDEKEIPIHVSSLFGARTRQGLVRVEIGPDHIVMSPTKAREIAGILVEAAESAETDELLVRFFGDALELEQQQALSILVRFRALRAEFRTREMSTGVPPAPS